MINVKIIAILWFFMILSLYQSRNGFMEEKHSRICGLPSESEFSFSECDLKSYAVGLSKIIIPAMIMVVLTIIMAIVFSILILCGCCRWKRKVGPLPMSILIGIASLMTIIGLIVTIIGNVAVESNVHDGFDIVSDTLVTAENNLDKIYKLADDYHEIIDVRDKVDEVREKVNEYREEYNKIMKGVKFYENIRSVAIYIVSIIPIFLLCLSYIAIFFHFRLTIGVIGWLSIFFSIILWLSLAAILVASQIIDDVCWEVEISKENSYGLFSDYLNCNKDDGFIGSIRLRIEEELDNIVNIACAEANEICRNSKVICGDFVCKDKESLFEVEKLMVDDNGDMLLISQCAIACTNEDLRLITGEIMRRLEDLKKANDAYNEVIELIDCEFVVDSFGEVEVIVCKHLDRSANYIIAGNILQALGLLLLSIVLIYIFKSKNIDEEDHED